jgi:glycosyltransferase involved in cell wall biosynthesis
MTNKISVVIPVYNGEKCIRESVESVLKQTFLDIEVIVINDGSTDTTLEIIQSITDSRLKIFSYINAGLAASRNRGITHSTGEYISFIDADDLWTVNKLESQFQALQENKKAAVAYSWTDYIDDQSKFLKAGRRITATGDIYNQLLVVNFLENGSNPLITREALTTVGGFDESLPAAEDWDMWLRLAAGYEFILVPEAQILYRVSVNSMSANLKRQEGACLQVIETAFTHSRATSLQHLKKFSLAQIYKYLTFKALEVPPKNLQRWIAARFLWNYVRREPSVLRQKHVILVAIFKILFPRIYYFARHGWESGLEAQSISTN